MVDANVLVREWLLAQTSVTSLIGTGNINGGVYCGDVPEHFDPTLGPCIQIQRQGGSSHSEIPAVIDARMHIRVWAGVEQYLSASQLYSAVRDVMHGAEMVQLADGFVIRCIETVPGQDVTDPDTGWATVFGFFQLMARN